ncbi:MAG: sodium:proton antiporter [Chromatiales bacterium]|nr:sodium:proton antiporter [Chromatiales bacterium]
MAEVVLSLMLMLLLALLARPLAERMRLPFSAVLVVIGFIGSELMIHFGGDTGVRAELFHDLVFFVFLPILIFESAFVIDAEMLWKNLAATLILAIPILLFSTFVTGALIYWGIAHPDGFPWIAALLAGALLSATDPVAVVALARRSGAPKRLVTLLEGESLFNDATAIVVFGIFLSIASMPEQPVSFGTAAMEFSIVFFGGTIIGILVALLTVLLLRAFEDPTTQGIISVISAYCAFIAAEHYLHVSGVMAVLALGLVVGRLIRADYEKGGFVERLWELAGFVANSLVFLLMGVTITLAMFEQRWLAILIGIAGVLVARAAGMFALIPLANRFTPQAPIDWRYQAVLFWGGLRGAVTLALALSIPVSLDYWWTIQSIAFGVVVFTLFVQAPTMPWLLRRLALRDSDRS